MRTLASAHVAQIPAEFRAARRWVVFALVPNPGKKDRKIPLIAGTTGLEQKARSDDPRTWRDFETALRDTTVRGTYLGFAFNRDFDHIFLDLDDVRDASGVIIPEAGKLVSALDTYTERSLSGAGLHIIGRGSLPERFTAPQMPAGSRLESYPARGARFCLLTGDVLSGRDAVQDCGEAIAALFPPRTMHTNGSTESAGYRGASGTLTDDEMVAIVKWADGHWADGRRHHMALHLSGYLGKQGVPREQAVEIIEACADSDSDPGAKVAACHDTYDDLETGADVSGWRGLVDVCGLTDEQLVPVRRTLDAFWKRNQPQPERHRLRSVVVPETENDEPPKRFVWTLAELLDADFPPVQPMVGGILDRGGATSLFGAGGAGKSWLSLSLSLSIATGTPWLDHFPVAAGRVLVIDQEGRPDRVQARLQRLCEAATASPETPMVYARPSGWRVDTPTGYLRLQELIDEHTPDLVVIDSGTRFHQADENKSQEMANIAQHFAELTTDRGIALLIVDHANKASLSDDPRARLRGSTDKLNALDAALYVERAVGSTTLNVTPVKSRYDVELAPFSIVFDHTDGRTRLLYQESVSTSATPDDALSAVARLSADDPYGATIDTIGFALFPTPLMTSSQRSYRTRHAVNLLERQGRIVRVDVPREGSRGGRKTAYQMREER